MSRVARALVAAAGVLAASRESLADEVRFPARDVRVHVALAGDGRSTVTEEYALTARVNDVAFEFLGGACAAVGPISATFDGRAADAEPSVAVKGPWTALRFSGITPAREVRLRYDVETSGVDAAIPIVMPTDPLEAEPGERGARVRIELRWSGTTGTARVVMPRLEPDPAGDVWTATQLAMPSTIRVRVPAAPDAGACRRDGTGDAGGVEWRFSVFVLTMVVWATAYLWWAGRSWAARS